MKKKQKNPKVLGLVRADNMEAASPAISVESLNLKKINLFHLCMKHLTLFCPCIYRQHFDRECKIQCLTNINHLILIAVT